MNINFQDPEILIPAGVILVCVAAFFWAVGRLFKKSDALEASLDGLSTPTGDESLFEPAAPASPYPDFAAPPPAQASRPAGSSRDSGAPSPAVSKEMVERLDTMTQRLSDMQSVLQRQAATAPAGAPLTPETIDKLLKIVGNVTQQVDLLQRSLGAAPSTPSLAPLPTPALGVPKPSPVTSPVASSSPVASPPPAAVPRPGMAADSSGKGGIGLAGGALSKFAKPAATPPGKTGPGPGTPPAAPPSDK